ncbi:MAG: PrsW family intramembrane metalloprotease [Oribacterium sp.]|nr:PrsW family intramembrane metalloprotease [Oribacterium sp.]
MIFAVMVQFIVCFLIMKWVLKQKPDGKFSTGSVVAFFVAGAIATIPDLALAIGFDLDGETFKDLNPYLGGFLTAFLLAAVMEEVLKYIAFRLVIRKNKEVNCWLDAIIAAIVVGIGFALFEDVTYGMFGDGNIMRAILPVHILFQLLMGYFYGKARVTKQFGDHVLSLAVPILCHTVYDMFALSIKVLLANEDMEALRALSQEEIMKLPFINDAMVMAVGMFVTTVGTLVAMIIMLKKLGEWSKNGEKQELI